MSEKTAGELLKEELFYEQKNAGLALEEEAVREAYAFCEDYKTFLDHAKTERDAVKHTVALLESRGYVPFRPGKQYGPGDRVYLNNRDRALIFATVGTKPLEEGVSIIASHIDSPRMDLKPNPLYEEAELALFKTHYYGGVRKYQWTAIPLALHGAIYRKDGSLVEVNIGEDEGDPVFMINDLLPHLSKDQNKRTLQGGLEGEELNILVGCLPFRDDKVSEKVKLNILKILREKYGITEQDFRSAELCAVPAMKAKDLGFDRSMVAAYGQDDKVCAYTSIMAEVSGGTPEYTSVVVLADKEEVGSDSNTGLHSWFLNYFIADLAEAWGIPGRRVLSASKCLSADVSNAFDPTFASVSEKRNSAYLNYGACIMKYTGSGGKGGTNDSDARFMNEVLRLMDAAGVLWQTAELGKVDQGGGGTVAKYISQMNVDTVDIGVPVLSMHAPYEVVSKLDVYMTYKAFEAFRGRK